MDAFRILVAIGALVVSTKGQPVPVVDNNQNFVPGVFISADALKDLQEKAQQNGQSGSQPILNPIGQVTSINRPLSTDQLKLSVPYQSNSAQSDPTIPQQPIISNQPILQRNDDANQQNVMSSIPLVTSQPIGTQSILASQQNQPILAAQSQPILMNQPNQPQILTQAQPGNQQLVLSQQPNQQLVVAQQPNQPTILVSQQPGYSQGNQLYLSQPPNQQVVLQNGQLAQIVSQPGNQLLIQGSRQMNTFQNSNQNPGTLYAVVPINGQNMPAPNTNLGGNSNTYLVPVQQMPQNQVYTING